MNLAFLLEDTAIGATARTAMALADALIGRGHRVRIVTKDAPVTWRSSRAEWIYVDEFREYRASDDDRILDARELASARYIVDDEFFRSGIPRENEPLRVLLAGSSQRESRGLADGYGAAAHARWFHQQFELVRVSPWAPSKEEPLDAVDEFHVALTTAEMTRLMHSCDVFIAPGLSEDGVDLPALEALASGLACVFTATDAHLALDSTADYALFGPETNAVELGERLIELLDDAGLRERLRLRGRQVAEQWRAGRVADAFEKSLAR